MNAAIPLHSDFTSFTGSLHTLIEPTLMSYHIKLKKDSLDSEIIEKQNLMIQKLKNDNSLVKAYLSKAVAEINVLKISIHKTSLLPTDITALHEYVEDIQSQNTDLKKELEEIQSELARYKDSSEQRRDALMAQISNLKRQIQDVLSNQEALHEDNARKYNEINERYKEIWKLQSRIAELTEQNYRRQSIIDKLKISYDQKSIREDFRYLTSAKQNPRQKTEDILIEGQEQITTSDYEAFEKVESGVQTQVYEVSQFIGRCVQRNTPTKRKNHHISPETDKEEKIRAYARQLTQKQEECKKLEKTLDFLKKQNKQLEEIIQAKEREVKKYNKKYKKLAAKLNSTSKVDSSDSSSDVNAEISLDKKHDQPENLARQFIQAEIAIQTDKTRIQNQQQNAQKKKNNKKANHQQIITETSFQEPNKKEKRRKNRTIEQDQEDGRQKLKSLIEDLEKKDSLLVKLELQATRNRETLNQTRQKLRKKENQCKRLARDLKGIKSQLSQNNSSHEGGEPSLIGSDSKADRRSAEIQTGLVKIESEIQNKKITESSQEQLGDNQAQIQSQNEDKKLKIRNESKEQKESELSEEDEDFEAKQKPEELKFIQPDQEQLKISIPDVSSKSKMISHVSPRSESHSHRQPGQRIVNVEKLEKHNSFLQQENYALKYELEELKKKWIEGLKNLQKEYCSESGSDFHSERDLFGVLSDRQIRSQKIREICEEEAENSHEKTHNERPENNSVAVQTEEIEQEIEEEIIQMERKRSSRMIDNKSQKSQAKSDKHHSHSKNELEVSSEADKFHNNELIPIDKESRKKKVKNQLNLSQQKVRLKSQQNSQLRKQIKDLEEALNEAKKVEAELLEKLKQEVQSNLFNTESQLIRSQQPQKQQVIEQIQYFNSIHNQSLQNAKSQKEQGHNQSGLMVDRSQRIFQEAEVQTEDHEAVEISCIERAPDKNIDLSLRNDNLFDLEQPITCEQEVQTEDIELSFYRSFKVQHKQDQNMFESLKMYSDELADKHGLVGEKRQAEGVMEEKDQFKQGHSINKLQDNLGQSVIVEEKAVEGQQKHEVNENSGERIGRESERTGEIQEIKQKKPEEELKTKDEQKLNNQNKELQLRLKDLEEKVAELNEALERERAKELNKAKNEPVKEVAGKVRVESRCPSYMNESQISYYKAPVEYEHIEVQTQEVEHSFSLINHQSQNPNPIPCQVCQIPPNSILLQEITHPQNQVQDQGIQGQQNEMIELESRQEQAVVETRDFAQSIIEITGPEYFEADHAELNIKQSSDRVHEFFSSVLESRNQQIPLAQVNNEVTVEQKPRKLHQQLCSSDGSEIKSTDSRVVMDQGVVKAQQTRRLKKAATQQVFSEAVLFQNSGTYCNSYPRHSQRSQDHPHYFVTHAQNPKENALQPLQTRFQLENLELNERKFLENSIVQVYVENSQQSGKSYWKAFSKVDFIRDNQKLSHGEEQNRKLTEKEIRLSQESHHQLRNEASIYKEELKLTQEENYRLERQIHQFTMKINDMQSELQVLNEKISVLLLTSSEQAQQVSSLRHQNTCLRLNILVLNEKVANKEGELHLTTKELAQTKELLVKLNEEHGRIIMSLDQYVDDSSDGNTPDKRSLLRDFQLSIHNNTYLESVSPTIPTTINEPLENIIQTSAESIVSTNTQTLFNASVVPANNESSPQGIDFKESAKTVHTEIGKTENTFHGNQSYMRNQLIQLNQTTPSNLEPVQNLVTIQNQIISSQFSSQQLTVTQQIQFTSEKTTDLPQAKKQSQQHQIQPKQPQNQTQSIIEAPLDLSQDNQCVIRTIQIKRLTIQTIEGNESQAKIEPTSQNQGDSNEIQGDSNEIQGDSHEIQGDSHEIQGDSHEIQGDSHEIQGDSHEIQGAINENQEEQTKVERMRTGSQQDQHITNLIIEKTGSEIFKCKQCQNYSSEIKHLEQKINELNAKIDQLIAGLSKRQSIQVSAELKKQGNNENHQEQVRKSDGEEKVVEGQDFDRIFSIQNLANLPFIYYDYNAAFNHEVSNSQNEKVINSLNSSSLKTSLKLDVSQGQSVVRQNQEQLEELYQPGLVLNSPEVNANSKEVRKSAQKNPKQFKSKDCQTNQIPQILQQSQQIYQQGQQKQAHKQLLQPISQQQQQSINDRMVRSAPAHPLVYLENENQSERSKRYSREHPFDPVISFTEFELNLTRSKARINDEINQILLENFLKRSNRWQKTVEREFVRQLSVLVMKLFEWILKINETFISQDGLGKVGRKESEDEEMLLEDYCRQVPPSHIDLQSNIKQGKGESKDLMKEIVKLVGSKFLDMGCASVMISEEEFRSISKELLKSVEEFKTGNQLLLIE